MGNCLGSAMKPLRPSKANSPTNSPSRAEHPTSRTYAERSTSEKPAGRSANKDKVFPVAQNLETRSLRVYTLAELKRATENFKPQAVIGEGEFGKVFKGWVDKMTLNPAVSGHGMPVAVKRHYLENMQGLEEWLSEVSFAGRRSHPNVVKLLGCCRKDRELLLVNDFMPLGSLDKHLFASGKGFKPLSWSLRMKIAIGAARGLAFLHNADKQIIYRDFKTSNVLLDSGYNAKLSNFGLAKDGPTDEGSHVVTKLKGTYGYAAPEYIATGRLYVKSDVYGFGVVLLETLSGQHAFDATRPSGKHYLVEWAKPYLSDYIKLTRVMDPKLQGQYPSKGALQVAQLTLRCLDHDRRNRPSMNEVVDALEQIEAMKTRDSGERLPWSWACTYGGQDSVSHPLPLPPNHSSIGLNAHDACHSSKAR